MASSAPAVLCAHPEADGSRRAAAGFILIHESKALSPLESAAAAAEEDDDEGDSVCVVPRPQPLPEGQRREWEDWEYSWMTMMPLGFVLYGIAYYNRPYHSIDEWARARARADGGEGGRRRRRGRG